MDKQTFFYSAKFHLQNNKNAAAITVTNTVTNNTNKNTPPAMTG
jgi:hypothetical protein